MPSVIMCGIIEESFKLLHKNKQCVISIDCKKIATGLAKDDVGDINLWGLEETSIEERQRRKEENLKEVTELEENILELLKENSTESVEKVLSNITSYICDISTELGHKKLLQRLYNLSINNPDKKANHNFGMNTVKEYIYTTSVWIERALQNNKRYMPDIS